MCVAVQGTWTATGGKKDGEGGGEGSEEEGKKGFKTV